MERASVRSSKIFLSLKIENKGNKRINSENVFKKKRWSI